MEPSGGWKPWKQTDPRTGRRFNWSYNPNIAFGIGLVIGSVILLTGWWISGL